MLWALIISFPVKRFVLHALYSHRYPILSVKSRRFPRLKTLYSWAFPGYQKSNISKTDHPLFFFICSGAIVVPWVMVGQQADASQSFGSGLTYVYRCFLLKLFGVSTVEDDPDRRRSIQRGVEETTGRPPARRPRNARHFRRLKSPYRHLRSRLYAFKDGGEKSRY